MRASFLQLQFMSAGAALPAISLLFTSAHFHLLLPGKPRKPAEQQGAEVVAQIDYRLSQASQTSRCFGFISSPGSLVPGSQQGACAGRDQLVSFDGPGIFLQGLAVYGKTGDLLPGMPARTMLHMTIPLER